MGFTTLNKLRFVPLALALLYLIVVFGMRWLDRRAWTAQQQDKREAAGRLPKEIATSELKVLAFYASPATLRAGEQGLLCYGVINARLVTIEPGGHKLTSSLGRCVAISPRATTRYTLTAEDAEGKRKTATLDLEVR